MLHVSVGDLRERGSHERRDGGHTGKFSIFKHTPFPFEQSKKRTWVEFWCGITLSHDPTTRNAIIGSVKAR